MEEFYFAWIKSWKCCDNFHTVLIIKLSTEIPLYKDQGGKILVQVMFVEHTDQKGSPEKPEIHVQQ